MRKNKGFTLIELLVVIFIIILLATLVIINVSQGQKRARDSQRKANLHTIQNALEAYANKHGSYPVTQPELRSNVQDGLVNADPGCTASLNREPGSDGPNWIPELVSENFLSKMPEDPLPVPMFGDNAAGTEKRACYIYQSDGDNYILSAWDTVETGPILEGDDMFSWAGFRQPAFDAQYYLCHYDSVGKEADPANMGSGGYYSFSYTLTNMTCN